MKSLLRVLILQLIIFGCSSLQAQWVYTGGPGGGNVSCFAFTHDSSGRTTVFAGTDRGVYRSTDNGANWQSANSGMSAYTWVTGLVAVPDGAGGGCLFAVIDREGVFRSTDGGASWTLVNNGLPITDIENSLSDYYFIVTELVSVQDKSGGTTLLATNDWGMGVYRSTDMGNSWSKVPVSPYLGAGISSFAACSDAGGDITILAGTGYGIYRSTDGGLTWQAPSSGSSPQYLTSYATTGTNVLVGSRFGVFLSTDCGLSWIKRSDGLPVIDSSEGVVFVNAVGAVRNESGGTSLFASAGFGSQLFVSTDFGRNWSPSPGLPEDGCVEAISACDSCLFVSMYQKGVFLSTDVGKTWITVNSGLPNTYVTSLAAVPVNSDSTLFFVGTRDAGILCSSDDGASWHPVNNDGLDTLITCLAAGPSKDGGGDLYAGTYTRGMFHSSDNGESWRVVNTNWVGGTVGINAIVVAGGGTDSSQVYAATNDGIYLSTDAGSNWGIVNQGLPDPPVGFWGYSLTSLAALPVNSGTVFVSVGHDYGVYRTTNRGASWSEVNNGLADKEVRALAAFSLDGQGAYVFAATPSGLFVSNDYGASWGLADSSWSTTPISSIVNCGTNIYILAGEGGIWRRPISQLIATAVRQEASGHPEAFRLYQNFPNPFNPSTTISYELSANRFVSLKVYDVLGREVKTLVNEVKKIGRYEVQFDASGLASGVYFYRIRAGNFAKTMKLMLMK